MDIVIQEATIPTVDGVEVVVPDFMTRLVATIAQEARRSPHLNQRSGVSVRMSLACQEALAASAVRRAVRAGEPVAVPRVSDLEALPAAMAGKVEVDSLDEDRDGEILMRIVQAAVLSGVSGIWFPETLSPWCGRGVRAHDGVATGDDLDAGAYPEVLDEIPALATAATVVLGDKTGGHFPVLSRRCWPVPSSWCWGGLHLSKRLNKRTSGPPRGTRREGLSPVLRAPVAHRAPQNGYRQVAIPLQESEPAGGRPVMRWGQPAPHSP
ncbi:MAG: hypothetical protein CM1200mP26_27110 [Acidimicrobiales bacterium]|nr:MAG: hypothetical protein CM1200mP26_27110 [Acidimicrobiales bacterium]